MGHELPHSSASERIPANAMGVVPVDVLQDLKPIELAKLVQAGHIERYDIPGYGVATQDNIDTLRISIESDMVYAVLGGE